MSEVCELILGNRGSGKSAGLKVDLLRLGIDREYAVACFDAPGDLAYSMVGHLCAHGIKRRTYYEKLSFTSKMMQWPFYEPSTAESPLKRQIDTALAIEQFCQVFYARRNEKGGQAKPYTSKYMRAAVAIWMSQRTPKPVNWVMHCFRPGTAEYELLMKDAEDKEAVHVFFLAEQRARKNPIQWEIETGAAERILEPLCSPVVWARHGNSADIEQLLEEKAQMYFDLSGVPQDDARTFVILMCNLIINACRKYFEKHNRPLRVILVLEEAGALSLVTPLIIQAMQELRKAGIFVKIISQTTEDFRNGTDQSLLEQIMALTDRHVYYRMNSGLDRVAADLAIPTFDPLAIHYSRDRMINDGVEAIETTSKGKSTGPAGEREDERTGTSFITKYKPIVEHYYKSYQLQEVEWAQVVTNLKVGERTVRDHAGVRQEAVKMLPPAWPLGLTGSRTRAAIIDIFSRPCFQSPITYTAPIKRRKKGVE